MKLSAKIYPFILLTALFFMVGCSVEKRRYTSGYHVTWNGDKSRVSKPKPTDSSQQDSIVTAHIDNETDIAEIPLPVEDQVVPVDTSHASSEVNHRNETKENGFRNKFKRPAASDIKKTFVGNVFSWSEPPSEKSKVISEPTKALCISSVIFTVVALLSLIMVLNAVGPVALTFWVAVILSWSAFSLATTIQLITIISASLKEEKLPAYFWISFLASFIGMVALFAIMVNYG